jgi:hypothetical protein
MQSRIENKKPLVLAVATVTAGLIVGCLSLAQYRDRDQGLFQGLQADRPKQSDIQQSGEDYPAETASFMMIGLAESSEIIDIRPVDQVETSCIRPGNLNMQCPVSLTEFCFAVQCQSGSPFIVWLGYSDQSLPRVAESILLLLDNDGWTLLENGYLDIFNDAWGCLVSRQVEAGAGEVLEVIIMPTFKYEAISQTNPLVVRIIQMTTDSVGSN